MYFCTQLSKQLLDSIISIDVAGVKSQVPICSVAIINLADVCVCVKSFVHVYYVLENGESLYAFYLFALVSATKVR